MMKKKCRWVNITTLVVLLAAINQSQAQDNFQELRKLINGIRMEMPSGFGESSFIEYTFINAGCYCSLSQATTGKKEKMNAIITFSFNLSEIKDGIMIVSKPKDSDYKPIPEDIWTIQIGTLNILVQNTDWQSRQTNTNHFYFLLCPHWLESLNSPLQTSVHF